MSEAAAGSPESFARAVIPLLKEYTAKFGVLRERIRHIYTHHSNHDETYYFIELDAVRQVHSRLEPAALELARQVSGIIEHGSISSLEKAELRLRLAEYEASLLAIQDLLNVYQFSQLKRK